VLKDFFLFWKLFTKISTMSEGRQKMKRVLVGVLVVSVSMLVVGGLTTSLGAAETLTVWHGYTQKLRQEAVDYAAKTFEEEYPGVDVKLEAFSWTALIQKWPGAFAAGTLPDVINARPPVALGMWYAGALTPVDDVVEDLGGADNLFGVCRKLVFYEGHWLAIPHYGAGEMLYYRKDRFRDVGLDEPVSWDELLTAAQKVSNPPEYYGYAEGLSPKDYYGTKHLWTFMMVQPRWDQGEFFDEKLNINFNTPAAVRAVKFFVKLLKTGPEGMISYTMKDRQVAWLNGLASMMIDSTGGLFPTYRDAPQIWDGGIEVTQVPIEGLPLGDYYAWASISTFARTVNAKKPELAGKFMVHLNKADVFAKFSDAYKGHMWPVIKSLVGNPALEDEISRTPVGAKAKRLQYNLLEHGTQMGCKYGPNPYADVLYGPTAQEMFHKILLEDVLVEKAVADTHAKLEKKVEELKRRKK
jgi:ABC-type glycerol-3-phosphate transport system substrate-binding protein